jgi:hypothetical protein
MSLLWGTQTPMSFAVESNIPCDAAAETIGRFMVHVLDPARERRLVSEIELDRITRWKARGHPDGF